MNAAGLAHDGRIEPAAQPAVRPSPTTTRCLVSLPVPTSSGGAPCGLPATLAATDPSMRSMRSA